MPLRFEVFESIYDLPDNWNGKLSKENALYSDKIGVTEKARVQDIKNFYIIGYDMGNHLILQCYFQQLSIHSRQFHLKGNHLKCRFVEKLIDWHRPKLLVVGNLFRHDAQMIQFHGTNLNTLNQSIYLEETLQYMMRYSKSHGVFLKDLPKQLAEYFLNKKDYKHMENDISMFMNFPPEWEYFEDYTNALKHKYTQRARKVRKAFKSVRIETLEPEKIEQYKTRMHELYLMVTQNQIVSMGELSPNFIPELKKSLGDHYQVTGFFYKDELIAFSSAIIHDNIHDMNYIGFDYSLNKKFALYFNILFHCVECAIGNRRKKLILGRTALEAKAIIGCEPDFLFSFYRLKNPMLNYAVQNISKRFQNRLGENWQNRHPFANKD